MDCSGTAVFNRDNIELAYRHFSIPSVQEQSVILESSFILRKAQSDKLSAIISDNLKRKKSTQPVSAHSAGCVFKNPAQGISAGKLLDDCGFKDKMHGGVAFSSVHANFLINKENGTSEQAFELLQQAQSVVAERFGYSLHLEVKVVG